jgi:hypothetical protein
MNVFHLSTGRTLDQLPRSLAARSPEVGRPGSPAVIDLERGSEINQGIPADRDNLGPDFTEALRIHDFARWYRFPRRRRGTTSLRRIRRQSSSHLMHN